MRRERPQHLGDHAVEIIRPAGPLAQERWIFALQVPNIGSIRLYLSHYAQEKRVSERAKWKIERGYFHNDRSSDMRFEQVDIPESVANTARGLFADRILALPISS